MNDSSKEHQVSYYLSTHPCVMVVSFLLIAFIIFRFCENQAIPPDEKWKVDCAIGIFIAGAAFYAIKWMHSVRFTIEEIVFYRLGIVYRRIPWNQIIQAGIAKEYKAAKLTIVLTPANCPKYDSQYSTTTHYVEKHRWKLILLDATKDNKEAVHRFYGEFGYEAK